MNWTTVFFVILPYMAVAVCVGMTAYRAVYRPSTLSSLTSQLLEHKKLYWGSTAFHWGVMLTLAGHVLAIVAPRALQLWDGSPIRLYLLEATGMALGLWALAGLLILLWRRASEARIRAVTSPMDVAIMLLLLVSLATGVSVALLYPYGSLWFTGVATPYLWSLATLRPRPELLTDMAVLVKIHVFNFFLLLAAFPFSRLVHVITLPLSYLYRPWQLVIWNRRPVPPDGSGNPAAPGRSRR